MDIKEIEKNWNEFGKRDALWAILTNPSLNRHKWDVDRFFKTGEGQVAQLMGQIDSLGLNISPKKCLDFGCGVGRLTQALCRYFDECHGIDIAPSMIKLADRYNRYPNKCHYYINSSLDLKLFDQDCFDFIYSALVLQHMRPEYSTGYIREFLRILKSGGTLVFQVPGEYISLKDKYSLPDSAFKAQITIEKPIKYISPGAQRTVIVKLKNISDVSWPSLMHVHVTYHIRLANHWLSEGGAIVVNDDARAELPIDLHPSDDVIIPLTVTGPKEPGNYILELDMVQECVAWFKDRGSETAKIRVKNIHKPLSNMRRMITGLTLKKIDLLEQDPPIMEVYGIKKEDVIELIRQHGGRIVHIWNDGFCGEEWESFTYVVTK